MEVQIPFVQVAFPEAKILAAVVGAPDLGLCERFGRHLARHLEGRQALIVASSDLSHYPGYDDAVAADSKVLEAIARLDGRALKGTIRKEQRRGRRGLSTCACGEGPILAAISAAGALGATRGKVISYANSGDAPIGDRKQVVGYGAVALFAGGGDSDTSALRRPEPPPSVEPLAEADKLALLGFARQTVERFLATETAPLARDLAPSLWQKQGAFVTLKKNGQLRGCIGHMAEDRPLGQVVGAMALQAAFNDSRFSPLQAKELRSVDIEISVLTPFRRVSDPKAILIGRDGVVISKSGHSAVYLPQVATEQGWTRKETLNHLCRKAGLPRTCWHEAAELYTFQADVFHEG